MDSLSSILPFEEEQAKIKKITVGEGIILPKGELSYSVKPPKNTDFLGNIPLSVFFYIDGKYQKRVYATIDIELMTYVVVSTRPLRRNHTITDVDIKTIQMDLGDLPSNVIVRKEDVLGKKLIRSVDTGNVLRKDLIDIPPMVNRNDIVMMVAESNSFRITAIGESQEDGNEGERVRVLNLDSKKEVYARVLDSNSVKIDF